MNINRLSHVFLIGFLLSSCNQKAKPFADEQPNLYEEKKANSKYGLKPLVTVGSLSEDGTCYTYSGPTNEFNDKYWNSNTNIDGLDKSLVKSLMINYVTINDASSSFFSGFQNVENLFIGYSVEGVYIEKKSLQNFYCLNEVKNLHFSIYGITDDFFEGISSMKNLEAITIEFPSVHFEWSNSNHPTVLEEQWATHLVKSSNLDRLSIPTGMKGVRFTAKTLDILLSKKWESIEIAADCFIEEELKVISKRKLPKFVKIIEN